MLTVSVPLFLISCSKKEKTLFETLPPEAALEISQTADKFFAGNKVQKKNWMEKQAAAWKELNSAPPTIPLLDYSLITENAKKKFPSDFEGRLNFVKEQLSGYKSLDELSKTVNPADWNFVKSAIGKFAPDDFQAQSYMAEDWINFNNTVRGYSQKFPEGTFQLVLRKALDLSKGSISFATEYMQNQYYAAIYISSLKPYGNLTTAQIDQARSEAAKKHPEDLVARRKFIESFLLEASRNNNNAAAEKRRAEIEARSAPSPENTVDENEIEMFFNSSVFTKRGELETVYTAVLAEYKGKSVVFCSKDFVASGLPVTLKNSRTKIVCSTAYVAENLPIVMLIPDAEPAEKPKMKVVSPEESSRLPGRKLLMFSPENGAIKLGFMKVFSEDEKYYNLSYDSAPVIVRTRNVKTMNRYSENLFITVSESVPQLDGSVVVDYANKRFVSYAMKLANPGVLEWGGRTGSVIGHESSAIPDFNTFVANFDASKKAADPNHTLRFLRFTAIDKWVRFNPSRLEDQKTKIRKLTDSNNDYLMFFKENLYSAALKNQRLYAIARRYRNDLVMQKMDQETFLRRYKSYMHDVLNSMRHDEVRVNPQDFYSIYRDELSYQLALRKAMFDYLSEAIREDRVVNIIHTDLRTRYQNPYEPYELRDFSGSLGTSF